MRIRIQTSSWSKTTVYQRLIVFAINAKLRSSENDPSRLLDRLMILAAVPTLSSR